MPSSTQAAIVRSRWKRAYGDEIITRLSITEVGNSSVGYAFIVSKNGQVCAEGNMVIVRVGE